MYVRGIGSWLRIKSLRWKFMLAPIVGVLMMAGLAIVLIKLIHTQIGDLERLHNRGFDRALITSQLSNQLAENHAKIYDRLFALAPNADEGEVYDAGKPLLLEIHRIKEQLVDQIPLFDENSREAELLTRLAELLDKYRVNTTNAMLMATVNPALSKKVMAQSTAWFNQLNAELLAVNEMIHKRLDRELAIHRKDADQQTTEFTVMFVLTILIMLGIGGVLANVLSHDLNRLIVRLGNLVAWEQTPTSTDDIDEVATLTVAIERVRESYVSLEKARMDLDRTNKKLNESHQTILHREKSLAQLNVELEQKVAEQEKTIADQKRAEAARDRALTEAELANHAKNEFLATMSHELRTPLNAIIGFSDMIHNATFGPIKDKYQDYAEYIRLSGEHLLSLISDILDISRIEEGALEIEFSDVSADEVFKQCVDMLQERASRAGLSLEYSVPAGLPKIYVDKLRLKQVLLNLAGNAIKFTPAGGKVMMSAERLDEKTVTVQVSDTGVGIAEGDIPRALEKFGQVRDTHLRSHEGAGIGLTLAKSLIEQIGGTFEIHSMVGKGTTVSAHFPIADG